MTLVRAICTAALEEAGIVGVGQTPLAEDTDKALLRLNWMIAQWRRKRFLVYRLVNLSVSSTGATSYTIGPAGAINTPVRPDRVESAFVRQMASNPNPLDYPLKLLQAREDYDRIALKSLTSFPSYLFYDPALPLGFLYPWPVMQSAIYSLFVSVKFPLAAFTGLDEEVELPDEYMAALHYNLSIRLTETYSKPPRPVTIGLAKDALNVIRGSNAAIARLTMPDGLVRSGVYNIYSDQ